MTPIGLDEEFQALRYEISGIVFNTNVYKPLIMRTFDEVQGIATLREIKQRMMIRIDS